MHFVDYEHACMVSCFSCVLLFATIWPVAVQAPLSRYFPSKNTGVGGHALLRGIFPTQGSNLHQLHLLHCRYILYHWATNIVKVKYVKIHMKVEYVNKHRCYFSKKDLSCRSYGFSSSHVSIWELDHKKGWTPKNWCFWVWCWRSLLRVSWTVRRSNQSILKEINPEYSLVELMLKLQYFGHLMQKADSLERTLMLGKDEGKRRKGRQSMRWLDGITDSMDKFEQAPGIGDGQGSLACCSP